MSLRPAVSHTERLALRRRGLALRSSLLRTQAVAHATELHTVLSWVDHVQDAWIWLRQRPPGLMLPMAAVAVAGVWRKPSRLWRWPLRAWSAWKLWQRVAQRRA